MKRRPWLTYEVYRAGECEAIWNGTPWTGRFAVGSYFSGKSKVYEGAFASLEHPDGRRWLGHDRWCPVIALEDMFASMKADGLQLACAGLDQRFYTTGLSDGSGYGFLRGLEDEGAFHIFDQAFASDEDQL